MLVWNEAVLCILGLFIGFGAYEALVDLIEFARADDIGMLWHAFLNEIFEELEIQVTKFGPWQNLCEVVLVVQDINDNVLLQILLEVLVIIHNNILEGVQQHSLEILFFG